MTVPSIETKISEAIRARVAALPMASTFTIVWTDGPLPKKPDGEPETSYTPDPLKRYLRVTWTPNATQRQFIGSNDPHRRPGVLQIDVFGTVSQGSARAIEVAGQAAQHFETDLWMSFQDVRVRVMKAPSVGPVFVGTHLQAPVLIELETYA
ncbi:phage tail terminator-like protein [Devosia sp. YIM 151766]|uniref:phage tail terminator-like protein n=1 Tax=Devosia sp. YIM 151766 TaxID=3017325 RepID=UPI00255C4DC2|nr:phage tail terminator-like protein [Devosia sp. YIM 151766]WIY54153.1 phage tail terminator-like protein [Devosia sp. YIM 151766]